MLQFLKFNKNITTESEFPIIAGSESIKFFLKRIGYVIFFLYSTTFIAAIDPFVINIMFQKIVFYVGGFITSIILIRLISHTLKFMKFSGGKIAIKPNKIIIYDKKGNTEISTDSLRIVQMNFLGNIIIRDQNNLVSFPIMLISDADRERFLLNFDDSAKKKTAYLKKAYDFCDSLLIAFILAMHIREYIVQAYYIPSGSMEDTLLIGDHLLVEKITYGPIIPKMGGMSKEMHLKAFGIRDIERNDILIFKPPNEIERDFIKRCIALPGDELHIKENAVFVNGKKLKEPFTKGFTSYDGFPEKKLEGIVPQGHIVVMGDNRENSSDSRAFGYLPVERIKGRAFILYWNTKHFKNFDFSRWGLIR
ncbi:MAG: signal peptidase I [Spirochaetota bacterium]